MSKFTAAGRAYLPGMSSDTYFPPPLVAKVRDQMERLVEWIEETPRSQDEVQMRCDVMVDMINALEDEFMAAGSEIETGARDDIAETVMAIFEVYEIDLDIEDALRERNW